MPVGIGRFGAYFTTDRRLGWVARTHHRTVTVPQELAIRTRRVLTKLRIVDITPAFAGLRAIRAMLIALQF
jgi:hypothetical protein